MSRTRTALTIIPALAIGLLVGTIPEIRDHHARQEFNESCAAQSGKVYTLPAEDSRAYGPTVWCYVSQVDVPHDGIPAPVDGGVPGESI